MPTKMTAQDQGRLKQFWGPCSNLENWAPNKKLWLTTEYIFKLIPTFIVHQKVLSLWHFFKETHCRNYQLKLKFFDAWELRLWNFCLLFIFTFENFYINKLPYPNLNKSKTLLKCRKWDKPPTVINSRIQKNLLS